MLTRRGFIAGAGAVAVGAVAGCGAGGESSAGNVTVKPVSLAPELAGLPARQHAWDAVLARDQFGNAVAPKYDRLLFFDVNGRPTPAHARVLEASLRTLEHSYPWSHDGLLLTAGWGPSYFEKLLGVPSPIPHAQGLSDFEVPSIDDYHLCLHLASDDGERLADVEAALLHGEPLRGASGPLELADALLWRETRTGFVGTGLPAANQQTGGIPPGNPVPPSSPLFMGFKSGFVKNQASEDFVTINDGPFAQGTTMQVSYMRLRLNSWYGNLSERERVARMYSPETTPAEVAAFTTDAPPNSNLIAQAADRYGVIGHSQTSGKARRNGKPLIIRRDFDTVDGGQAGLHFVALQRTIADFVTTRNAMNASDVQLTNPGITDTVNNGINEFIFVLKRANYVLPPRPQRSFPLLPGRSL